MIYNYINKNLPEDVDQFSDQPEDSEFIKLYQEKNIYFIRQITY